ncbi:beta-glucosidase M protein [Rutstroemia sp. NJR-2017a WRK4]|nr:beta-glucosidase M protein [Rutstroemia sp. NJR-2017a WRK4]
MQPPKVGVALLATLLHSCLSTAQSGSSSTDNATVITSETYFYGQSPPVYPSPNGTGVGDWKAAYAKAEAFVSQLTLSEKVNLATGWVDPSTGCSGSILPIPRLGFPGFCLQDATSGVRSVDYVNAYPSPLHIGASWNRELTSALAKNVATEFRLKGANVINGPVIGPLGRVTTGGRNWEGFADDPYLSGQLAAQYVKAGQEVGVIMNTKHYIANEQEYYRNPGTDGAGNAVASVSSNLDDRTLHELYLWPFADAVRAGSGAIMCSYNRVNNSHACQNSKTLNGILKGELGFQGFVCSDWGAVHSGVASALSGLDMEMPSGIYFGSYLYAAVTNGSVPLSRLDDMAMRIIATWYQMGQDANFTTRGVGIPINPDLPHTPVNGKAPGSKANILQGAIEGHVLVKNVNNALPLKEPALLSIYGYDAPAQTAYNVPNGTLNDLASYFTNPAGIQGAYAILEYFLGFGSLNLTAWIPTLIPGFPKLEKANIKSPSGGGSGSSSPPYISSPFEALSQRAYEDSTSLYWDFTSPTPQVDPTSTACLVFINAFATESLDRSGTHDAYSDNLILSVASRCANTIVVLHNAGIRLVDTFADHPNISAIVYAHLPGQDSGRALVKLLYGEENFSGKLPYTVARNESDYGNLYTHAVPSGAFARFPQSDFTEGLAIGYRAFEAKNITPRYEFGFGLSYTKFQFLGLQIRKVSNGTLPPYPTGEIIPGGRADLWDNVAVVTAQVANVGGIDGAEVAQLYVTLGGYRQLRGFEKVFVGRNGSAEVSFGLTRRDLSSWDVQAQEWVLKEGEYEVAVGASSKDLRLVGTLSL